jgi:tRNA pseudouridine38-40 synthase
LPSNSETLKIKAPHGKVKLTLEYDGTEYHGWQRQGPALPSIQQTIENVLHDIFKVKVNLMGAGRTDAGVHAENQIAHFIAPKNVRGYNFPHIFQAYLPVDVSVKKAALMPAHFHAQKSAVSKSYIYRIWNDPLPSALRARRSLWIRKPLDLERLNLACKSLLGSHDFSCFRSEGSVVISTVRTMNSAKFMKIGDYVEFHINGNGFLKQMVRNIVGTLLQLEFGQRDDVDLTKLIESKDRKNAGPTVEPQGLYLSQVFYPPELDNLALPL